MEYAYVPTSWTAIVYAMTFSKAKLKIILGSD